MANEKGFKSSVFGGFNKKDVAEYIEELARKVNEYKGENDRLTARCAELEAKLQEYEENAAVCDAVIASAKDTQQEIEALTSANNQLESENASLRAELATALESAAAYDAARERYANLEIELTKRSLEQERATSETAAKNIRKNAEVIREMQTALDNITRDIDRSREMLHAQFMGLESSIDDLAVFTTNKRALLNQYLIEQTAQN